MTLPTTKWAYKHKNTKKRSPRKTGEGKPRPGSTHPGSSASSSSARAALRLASSSCASAFSSLLRVLVFECGSYGMDDRVGRTEEHTWGSQGSHRRSCQHRIQTLGLQSLSQPAGPHLFGLVNSTELPGHLQGGGDGSWERVLSLARTGRQEAGSDGPGSSRSQGATCTATLSTPASPQTGSSAASSGLRHSLGSGASWTSRVADP